MWATWRAGAVPVLANRWWSQRELDAILADVRPALVITDAADLSFGPAPVLPMAELATWWGQQAGEVRLPPCREEDAVALIVYTAGSTGAPKGVQLSHRNLVATQQILHVMTGGLPPAAASAAEQKVALMTTPMFHNGGVTASLTALVDGNRMVFLRGRFDPAEALALIEAERAASWNAVPTVYARLLRHEQATQTDLSSLAGPSTGGTMVPPAVLALARDRLPSARTGLTVGYGMTEMAFISMATGDQVAARPGTVGRPIPLVEVAVSEPDADGQGELIGRSPAMMVGYFGTGQQPIDAEGWYHTGDLGRLDEDGFIYVTGRVSDMVIRGGENISCPHVEEALGEHDDILEVAVLGLPDDDLGEVLGAAVYPVPGTSLTPAGVEAFARLHLARFQIPTRWMFLSEPLPTTAAGKVDKVGLRRRFAAQDG